MGRRPLRTGFLIFLGIGLLLFFTVYVATWMVEDGSMSDDRIALVRIEGVIVDATDIIDEMMRYDENPSIKAILVRIDSPGGAVVPSQEIYDQIKRIRTESKKT
ncbi:MAG: ATP-dependent Clp protease proteolytic subunit, partial [Nitrospira sp.]|nr:ATP-dependent Clp protease proteolytic subunit [Nitrospira sp.]